MLDKTYQPKDLEERIYAAWEEAQAFACGQEGREDAQPYTIVIPPPNVTGSLHMGHALNNTIQDILVRFERMRGRDVLWQPGTDHAGIATQMVVERQLMENQEPDRREMGREKFVERIWSWKEESGGTIINQLRRLGASCDWSRERFTMDEGLSAAVLKVFVQLYREGLIYKDKRLVNWDPKLLTAISDLEVENIEVDGHMWHFRYPLEGSETYEYVEKDDDGNVTLRETRDYISIATTRPETMLGDGAVAVHPSDERYAPIVGKLCEIPVGPKQHRRLIPIITDEYPDPAFGSGAVKITGAHDFNDYAVAQRNGIPKYRLMDEKARMRGDGAPYAEASQEAMTIVREGTQPDENLVDAINLVPDEYRGLDRIEARKRVVADIDAEGLMIKVEDNRMMQPFGDRSNVVIEPMLTDQWFADAETLAKPAIAAVENGATAFVPKNWEKTYFEWMRNIQPWCISRQLWWGHRIPAWYGPENPNSYGEHAPGYREIFVAHTEEEVLQLAREFYPDGIEISIAQTDQEYRDWRYSNYVYGSHDPIKLRRDPDVLDTWFSSALWPFSTLGWPDETPELARHYKTDVLVTGFDIIFFWVARMMMMGLHFMEDEKGKPEVPFHTVYIHALVRDEQGAKMSKSKGNVMDPLEIIDEFGADALRFTLAAMAAQGRDIKLAKSRVEGYRNFGTKIWNAARFLEMNECARAEEFDPAKLNEGVNRWIAGEAEKAAAAVTQAIEDYRFNEAAGAIYQFVWHIFCDWYLELIKPALQGDDEVAKAETRATAAWAFDRALTLLHPFMPFITEELWARLGENGPARDTMLITAQWPEAKGLVDEAASAEFNWVIRAVTEIRSVRAEMNVPAGAKVPVMVMGAGDLTKARLEANRGPLMTLARIESISVVTEAPKGALQFVLDEATFALPLGDVIDIAAETERLKREIGKAGAEIRQISGKLSNEKFTSRAPEDVVEEQRKRLADAEAVETKLMDALKRLEAVA